MKESEIQKMSIDKIFRMLGFALDTNEVGIIIKDSCINKEKIFDDFCKNIPDRKTKDYRDYVIRFLKKHEQDIDKTALIMLLLKKYFQAINLQSNNGKINEEGIKKINEYISKGKDLLKGINKKIYGLVENDDYTLSIETVSAKQLCGGEKEHKGNFLKILEMEAQGLLLTEIINPLILTDFGDVICDGKLGVLMREQVFYNTAIKSGTELKRILENDDYAEKIVRDMPFVKLIPEIENAVIENIENIDFDKLLLCSAYRYIEYLDNFPEANEEVKNKEILRRIQIISNYLKGKNTRIEGRIEKAQEEDSPDRCEYISISYRVKDLEKDLEKFDGKTYWNKAQIEDAKSKLIEGTTLLEDVNISKVRLTQDEIVNIAIVNEENYFYLIKNGLIKPKQAQIINQAKITISNKCLKLLFEKEIITPNDLVDLYINGKFELEDIIAFGEKIQDVLTPERVYEEFNKENNDIGYEKMALLYKRIILLEKNEEEQEEYKQKVFDKYLETMDCGYLETFLNLGALSYEDLAGLIESKEWIKEFEDGQISLEFLFNLEQHGLITTIDLTSNKSILEQKLQLWEKGEIPADQICTLGLSIDKILELCDKGIIKGTKIGEIIPKDEREIQAKKIQSTYAFGMYETIRPLLASYNSDILNRDKTIDIIRAMKAKSGEITKLCEEGLLSGYKIAEFRYKGIISKNQFAKLKELGLVSDEEEKEVINNLTPEEMKEDLEKNGCKKIENINSILERISDQKTREKRIPHEPKISGNKMVINPIKRNEIFETLGADTIVTTPENGFKGYQAFLVPKLGIAILERLFRENKNGEIKPSYGDATYICEMAKFIQISGQSKKEVRDFMNAEGKSNGNVRIIAHTNKWATNLVKAISKVNPNIIVKRNNDKIESIYRGEEKLDINCEALNTIIGLIERGELSISLEEYE